MRLALLLLAASACAPPPLLLPAPPDGASAVAVVGASEGTLARLPLESGLFLPDEALEAHYFSIPDLPPGRVLRGEACDAGSLPAPMASYTLDADAGPIRRMDLSPRLRLPDAACRPRELAVAPYARAGCTLGAITLDGCSLGFDTLSCRGTQRMSWPVALDGTVCARAQAGSSCEPADDGPAASLASARCDDADYGVFALEPLELERQDVDLPELTGARIVDLVPRGPVILGVATTVGAGQTCGSVFFRYERATQGLDVLALALPCVVHFAELGGALWAVHQTDEVRFGVARLADDGTITASASVMVPDALRAEPRVDVSGLVDTTLAGAPPELTLVLRSLSPINRHHDVTALFPIDAATLRFGRPVVLQMSAADAVRDGAELWVSDDAGDVVEVFQLPLVAPLAPVARLRDDHTGAVALGPLLVAEDAGVYLVGKGGDGAGLDVFTERVQARAVASAPFVRAADAQARTLLRYDASRVFGVFSTLVRNRPEGDTEIWVTVFDLAAPERIAPGIRAQWLGRGAPTRARLDPDGVVWIAPRPGTSMMGLRPLR